jgi:DNA repair protein RadC
MTLALELLLKMRPQPTLRFLRAALASECPLIPVLVTAGVPHYEATEFHRRMSGAGELVDGRWVSEIRSAYAELVNTETPTPRRLEQVPDADRPREKALRSGIGALSEAELLALLLRTGGAQDGVLELAERLLRQHDGLIGLSGFDVDELMRAHGLGPAKASEVCAAFEIGRRLSSAKRRTRPLMRVPEEVVATLRADLVGLRHEELWCLPLDVRSRLISEPRTVSRGDVDGTDAGPRAFFRAALSAGATSCIAVHNHPTGDAHPSQADREVTRRLIAAGRAIDVPLVDHVIIGDEGRFTSLRRDQPELFR